MEINACWAERGLAATDRGRRRPLALVQVSDFAVGTLSTPNRLVPGDGDIPLARILGQVLGAGYRGCFDLELIGPAIDAEGYEPRDRPFDRRARVNCSRQPIPAPGPSESLGATAPGRRGNRPSRGAGPSPPGHV